MISRRTTMILATAYEDHFTGHDETRTVRGNKVFAVKTPKLMRESLYEFLYKNDFPAVVCNGAFRISGDRPLQRWIMRFHTGESIEAPKMPLAEREDLGQQILLNLAEALLKAWDSEHQLGIESQNGAHRSKQPLLETLELDGYIYRDHQLLASESDVLDVEEEQGVLEALYTSLGLDNISVFRSKLQLSEQHYIDGLWSDSVANSRLVLEGVLQEVASTYSKRVKGSDLPEAVYSKAVKIRQYLEDEGLLDTKEREVIQYTYGLLSNVGSHPYMAEKDQARLLRHMGLTLSQFVLLRLEGSLKQTS
jgi:hypothetical protein